MNAGPAHETITELEAAFARERAISKRGAAEVAYALACRYRNEDVNGCRRFDLSKIWATRAAELLDNLPSDTLCQIASTRISIGGVLVPDPLHGDVVRQRLADILA